MDAPVAQIQGTMPGAPLEGTPPESGAETKQCHLLHQPGGSGTCPDRTSERKPGTKGVWNKETLADMAHKLLSLVEQGDNDSSFSPLELLILFLEMEFFHT